MTRKQSQGSTSVSGGRDKRKVSIGPQIAPSEWKSQLRKDQVQVKKENQDENVTVSSTFSELQPPTLSSRDRGPSVSTINSNSSTSTSNQQPFANARSLLRTTKSNFSLGKAALQRSNLRMNHTLNRTSQEGIRDSWIDLGGETDFMRGSSSQADAGETQEVDSLKVRSAFSNQKENDDENGAGKEVESHTGWWASLKLRKQKSFAGIGGRNHKGE